MEKTVVELFAGVGGFRVGLNDVRLTKKGKVIEKGDWDFVWVNQWEPSTKVQHAYNCYVHHFGESENHVNEDIALVNKKEIPDHTLLVGGFPCQDYSVARGLKGEAGIQGKKGVLWWQIAQILKAKKPPFVLLENVDRLLRSPSTQRGRDFGIMLRTFNDYGYSVEWRVINAAEYGFAQRRRRVFIFAFHKSTRFYNGLSKKEISMIEWIHHNGFFQEEFPIEREFQSKHKPNFIDIAKNEYIDLVKVSDNFKFEFRNSGIMHKGLVYTEQTKPVEHTPIPLSKVREKGHVDERFFIKDEQLEKWKYMKGSKRVARIKPNGEPYFFSEGSMSFPDPLNKPGRTMLTSEASINRSSHAIRDKKTGIIRKITPVEAERLNGFPDNWTSTIPSERSRYFMMGNALVTSLVHRMSNTLEQILKKES